MSDSEADSQSGSRVRFAWRHHSNVLASPTIAGMSSFDEVQYDGYDEEEQEEIRFGEVRDEEVYPSGGHDSEVSSTVGSDTMGYATDSPHDFIDLTGDDVCRVIMTRQKDGVHIGCVCGNQRSRCGRPGHASKQGVVNKEGPPRFYVKLPGARGTCDGRLDRATFTRAEGERMLQDNRDEMEQMAQVLRDTAIVDEDSDDGVESITHEVNRHPSENATMSNPQVANIFGRMAKYVVGSGKVGGGGRRHNVNHPRAPRLDSPPARNVNSPSATSNIIRHMDSHSLADVTNGRPNSNVNVPTEDPLRAPHATIAPRQVIIPPPVYQEAVTRSTTTRSSQNSTTTSGTVPHIRGALRIMTPEQQAARRAEQQAGQGTPPGATRVVIRSFGPFPNVNKVPPRVNKSVNVSKRPPSNVPPKVGTTT